ncbi:hypothetical protein, partial [Hungatella effluvii]|uniref:hypothetical protein n=1 Tax=Hungatella effluvii TaxID=1096246 RepID=UPI002A8391E2
CEAGENLEITSKSYLSLYLITRAKKRFYSIINRIPAWNQAAMNQMVTSMNMRPFPAGSARKK